MDISIFYGEPLAFRGGTDLPEGESPQPELGSTSSPDVRTLDTIEDTSIEDLPSGFSGESGSLPRAAQSGTDCCSSGNHLHGSLEHLKKLHRLQWTPNTTKGEQ